MPATGLQGMAAHAPRYFELTIENEEESWGAARQHLRSCVSVMTQTREL